MGRIALLFQNYVLRRVNGVASPVTFWYLPEPARVRDAQSLERYEREATPTPLYLMDYSRKLEYGLRGLDGLIVLEYGPPIGQQLNPEAAFQYALALHDQFRTTGVAAAREEFLRYASTLLAARDPMGRWAYHFRWDRCAPPWHSVLAQSRGASVMLRAYRLTGNEAFREAAVSAIAMYRVPLEQGGFRQASRAAGIPYLEEYPCLPTGVFNGFLASLFGLYELGKWLDHAPARDLFAEYVGSALALLPSYTTRWWTLYDSDPESPFPNIHSPRYHRLVIEYLRVLAVIAPDRVFEEYRDRWIAMDTAASRTRATILKAWKKIRHR